MLNGGGENLNLEGIGAIFKLDDFFIYYILCDIHQQSNSILDNVIHFFVHAGHSFLEADFR